MQHRGDRSALRRPGVAGLADWPTETAGPMLVVTDLHSLRVVFLEVDTALGAAVSLVEGRLLLRTELGRQVGELLPQEVAFSLSAGLHQQALHGREAVLAHFSPCQAGM